MKLESAYGASAFRSLLLDSDEALELERVAREVLDRVAALGSDVAGRWVLVGVPAWNEAPALSVWIDTLPKECGATPLIPVLVDDGSSDGTASVARSRGWLVFQKPRNRGLAHSIHCLFELARRVSAPALLTMDGDGQHDPAEIGGLLEAWGGEPRALITGSRYLGATVGQSVLRTQGLKAVSWVFFALNGKRILDPACGFRLYGSEALRWMRISHSRHYAAETLMRGVRAGLPVREVPVTIGKRTAGASKQGRTLAYGARFTWVLLRAWWRARSDSGTGGQERARGLERGSA